MANFKIENGVPVPKQGRAGRKPKYPFADMKVGQHFDVPYVGTKATDGTDVAQNRLSSAASQYSKKHGVKFTLRSYRDQGFVRCWRTQ